MSRYIFFIILTALTILADIMTDPDSGMLDNLGFGASFLSYAVVLGRALMAVMFLHWARVFIFGDHLTFTNLLALNPRVNGGMVAIAIALTTLAFAIVMHSVIAI